MHLTINKQIKAIIPDNMAGMSAYEIVNHLKTCYKTSENENGEWVPENEPTKMMTATWDAVFDPRNWKAEFLANSTIDQNGSDATQWVAAAAIWYHGDRPGVMPSRNLVRGHGYQCD